jgi:hypothetical protein
MFRGYVCHGAGFHSIDFIRKPGTKYISPVLKARGGPALPVQKRKFRKISQIFTSAWQCSLPLALVVESTDSHCSTSCKSQLTRTFMRYLKLALRAVPKAGEPRGYADYVMIQIELHLYSQNVRTKNLRQIAETDTGLHYT